MAVSSFMGLVEILGYKSTSQIGPSQVEVSIDSLNPRPFGGIPSTGMEILNVSPECSGLKRHSTISPLFLRW